MPKAHDLILLPGLGADSRLLQPQLEAFPHLRVPGWLEPQDNESLASYGKRMALTLGVNGTFFLGGVSFGGMVALEMARYLSPAGVFLIASCTSNQALPLYAGVLGRIISRLPSPAFRLRRALAPLVRQKFGKLEPKHEELFFAMLETSSAAFLRWGCAAILAWSPPDLPQVPICHLHGSDDELIPVRRLNPDCVVAGAGHLVNLTHTQEVNQFLKQQMSRHLKSVQPGQNDRGAV